MVNRFLRLWWLMPVLSMSGGIIKCYGQDTSKVFPAAKLVDTGIIPRPFAPGIISTPFTEWSVSFTPDEQTVYSSQGAHYWTIVYSKLRNGRWTVPIIASFSGRFKDTDPFIVPDGKKIFFVSDRPLVGRPQEAGLNYTSLWYADLVSGDQWGTPKILDTAVNLPGVSNFAPSVSAKGTLYYCSRRKGLTGMQSFYTEWTGKFYTKPKQLLIKGAVEIQDPFIAPDESYLVFLDNDRLKISFKKNGEWLAAEDLGSVVNTPDGNSSPYVSHDGKTLYYTSGRTKGLYQKRDMRKPPLNYEQLKQESEDIFNGLGNILMVPLHLPPESK